MSLKINEIYHSIQGESSFMGIPCVFIRTSGCSLRCRWCDTEYAFNQGGIRSIGSILRQVATFQCKLVELTGGEPLDQPASLELMTRLCDEGYQVLLETGGHRPIAEVDPRVHRIVDVKCPGSKMQKSNIMENLEQVGQKDEVKFVVGDREDFDFAAKVVKDYELSKKSNPIFSPVFGELRPDLLAQWIIDEGLEVRFQIQQHKYVWGEDAVGV